LEAGPRRQEHDAGWGLYPIITIRRDGGTELAVHAFHKALSAQLAKVRAAVGDHIAVKFIGRTQKRDGSGYYFAYKTVKDGPGAAVDWATYSNDGDGDEEAGGSDLPSDLGTPGDFTAAPEDDEPLPF
jgi:hypothetical protein